jgi:hypothetical protein
MTCAAPLSAERPREDAGWREFRREEPFPNASTSRNDNSSTATGASTDRATTEEETENRFEKVAPVIEDFVFDVVRAGARLYFGVRDPGAAQDPHRRGGQNPTVGDRFERLKDVLAEARVSYRNRGQQPYGDRTRR